MKQMGGMIMNEVYEFLKENAPFFVTTVDGDKPKVRPFGFVMEYEGKLWFCTNNQKNIYRQLKANPYVEIGAFSPDRKWIRLHGKAVFSSTPDLKAKAREVSPRIASLYSVDDPTQEMFYLEEGKATFTSQATGESKTVKL